MRDLESAVALLRVWFSALRASLRILFRSELTGAAGDFCDDPGAVGFGKVDAGLGVRGGFAEGLVFCAARVIENFVPIGIDRRGWRLLRRSGRGRIRQG